MSPRLRRSILGAALAVPIVFGFAASALAEISGDCSAQINGANVEGRNSRDKADAIDVPEHAGIVVSGISQTPTDHVDIYMEFLGLFEWKVATDTFNPDTNWSSSVAVDDYAKYGVGLYRVRGSTGACSGAALVRVAGNPLGTVAGVAATAAAAAGVAALGAATARAGRAPSPAPDSASSQTSDDDDYGWDPIYGWGPIMGPPEPTSAVRGPCSLFVLPALLLTGAAMLGAVPAPAAGPRRASSLRLSFVGIAGGLLAALGTTVLLQQYSVLYPTRTTTIVLLALGLALGVALPTLANRRVVGAASRVAAARAARIAQARAARLEEESAPPPPPAADDLPPPPPEDLSPPPATSSPSWETPAPPDEQPPPPPPEQP
ncbi:MAG TPA: hypothetical protein VGB64_00985 [Actinomycetota bacterium]